MVRFSTRRLLTENFQRRYQEYLQRQPDDDQQIQVLRDTFPDLEADQHYQSCQILNNREHPRGFQNNQQIQKNQNIVENQRLVNQQNCWKICQFSIIKYHKEVENMTTYVKRSIRKIEEI